MSIKNKYTVKSIKPFETYDWLLYKHYAKRIPSISYAFGLFDEYGLLQGICTIGKPASPSLCDGVCGKYNSKYVYELNRLCVNGGLHRNTLSFFVANALKQLPKMILVSYADTDQNHFGYIYQATNWIYTGITKERTDIGSDGTHGRHYDKNTDYTTNRKRRSSKHRYVKFVSSRKQKKIWRILLTYEQQPYPKGETTHYDASYTPSTQTTLF